MHSTPAQVFVSFMLDLNKANVESSILYTVFPLINAGAY